MKTNTRIPLLMAFILVGCSGSNSGPDSALEVCEEAYSAYQTCLSEMGVLDTGDTTSDCDGESSSEPPSDELREQWECIGNAYASADCSSKKNMMDIIQSISECPGMGSLYDSGR